MMGLGWIYGLDLEEVLGREGLGGIQRGSWRKMPFGVG